MEKSVANGFVDLERKLLGRLGDALVERITGKLEGSLSPLASRFDGLEGAVNALAKTQGDLAQMQESLALEVGRVSSRLNELATDTAATKDATARHVARLADLAVELSGLKDLSSGLEARVAERFTAIDAAVTNLGSGVERIAALETAVATVGKGVERVVALETAVATVGKGVERVVALETAVANVGKGVERVVALETAVANVGKGVERVVALETAVARLGTDILRLAAVETAVSAVAKELQPVAALPGKIDAVVADLDAIRSSQADGFGSFAARQELVEGAVSALTNELRASRDAAEGFHVAVAGRAATTDERLGKLDGALLALAGEHQRLADLDVLAADKVALPHRFLAAIDDLVALLEAGDAATVVGATYVLEGSALGGAFLYPRLRAVGVIPEEALHHYRGHGDATFPIWMEIRGVLDGTPLEDQPRALAAARAVFAAMGRAYAALERLGEVREESGSYPVAEDRAESPLEKTGT
jgi:heme oxygenase